MCSKRLVSQIDLIKIPTFKESLGIQNGPLAEQFMASWVYKSTQCGIADHTMSELALMLRKRPKNFDTSATLYEHWPIQNCEKGNILASTFWDEGWWYIGRKLCQIWAEWAVHASWYLQKGWSKDFHLGDFSCLGGLFTHINHRH